MLELNMTLDWCLRSKLRALEEQRLLADVATQISMAIGNHKQYREAAEGARDRVNHYLDLLFAGNSGKKRGKADTSWQADMACMWEQFFGMSIAEANRKGL